MCEIFPEVTNCCYFFSLRVGMIFISTLAIMSGSMTWAITMQTSERANMETLSKIPAVFKNAGLGLGKMFSAIAKQFGTLIVGGICGMSMVFIFTGFVLLFANLSDNEGLVQVFVWGTFLNVMLGLLLILGLSIHCMVRPKCLLSEMDWLSGSAFLVFLVIWMFVWLYFVTVANAYVLGLAQ